jgi:hypothetical protein
MIASKLPNVSITRQRLLHLGREIITYLNSIVYAKKLTKGTLCNKIRKCGNPHCTCAHGRPHISKILSSSHHGHSKVIHLGKYSVLELRRIENQVKAYQRFRKARAEVAHMLKEIMTEINTLEQNLLVEIVPQKGARHGRRTKETRD